MKRTVRVVAALIAGPDSGPAAFLVQQRLPNKSRANLWEFPGGKVEAGETDAAALARECREELDVEIKVGTRAWHIVHAYDDFAVDLTLYRADIQSGTPAPLGAQAIRFCTPEEMKALAFCEADLPFLEALEDGSLLV